MKEMLHILMYVIICFAAIFGLSYISQHLNDKEAAERQSKEIKAAQEYQLSCLAKNIYYEAGSESFEGKIAVAQVTVNRVEAEGFPDDICDTVYQKTTFNNKTVCQFSWFCEPSLKSKPVNGPAYAESMKAARKVLVDNFRIPVLKKALYYHADYVNPGWNKPRLVKIGQHIFYGERVRVKRA